MVFATLLSSCAITGLNISHKTPKKPSKNPHFTVCDSIKGGINHFRACYDVHFYNLNVKFNIEQKSISGYNTISFTALKSFDTLQIDLYRNMHIDSIVAQSTTLHWWRRCDAVYVRMPRLCLPGDTLSFTVYYQGSPKQAKRPPWEGGFVWKTDSKNNPWVSVACEVDGASLWWPVKEHISDEPDSMRTSYTVPSGLHCIANGMLTDSVSDGQTTTYSWKVSYPINNYNVSFYIGKYSSFSIPYINAETEFDLSFYALSENYSKALAHFQQTYSIIQFFESAFGLYPWPRDGYKLIESPFAGMEHQTAIAYGSEYKNHYNYAFDYIILHETAHEWWGNSVTATDFAEAWIHEGFATYAEAMYVEHLYGYETYLNYLRFYAMLIKNKKPLVGPFGVNYWDYRDTDVYMKGALMLHTLRNSLQNDSLFRAIIKDFYAAHAYGHATSTDFITLVNEKSGKDFTAFFNQYLYSRVCPELEWEFFYNAEKQKNEIYYRWSNAVPDFSIPVKIKTGGRTFLIRPTGKIQRSELPEASGIIVNTDASYISLKRTKKFKKL